jgi:deoxyribodipyrimidine photo-lyase
VIQPDRVRPERPIFGKVRYMIAAGLGRKFDVEAYVSKIAAFNP